MAKTGNSFGISSRRKGTIWTREKITQLIELYQQHECLWNHYSDEYKHKEKRRKAIENICSNLQITKMDFGKKIHNLRNQFNSEMKKLERRIEETGDRIELTIEGCRWKHFHALKFLRDVIEPRPGGGGYNSKIRKIDTLAKYDDFSEGETDRTNRKNLKVQNFNAEFEQTIEYQLEDSTILHNSEVVETQTVLLDKNIKSDNQKNGTACLTPVTGSNDNILSPQTCARVQNIGDIGVSKPRDLQTTERMISQSRDSISGDNSYGQTSHCCYNPKDQCSSNAPDMPLKKGLIETNMLAKTRDQWDAFGDLVATEFRNLNSDTSRKKLKRKILQAILEIGEEDDTT